MSEVNIQDITLAYEKIIFAKIFANDEESLECRTTLMSELNTPSAFKNEYYVYYLMLEHGAKVQYSKTYVDVFLTVNKGVLSKNENIDYSQYVIGDLDTYDTFRDSCISVYDECAKTKDITMLTFNTNLQMYKDLFLQRESIRILETGADILAESKSIGRRTYSGYKGMRDYVNTNLDKLDKINEKSKRTGAVVYGKTDKETKEKPLKKLGAYGIKALDEKIQIYEGEMHSILAPAKGGKSRFVTQAIETCLCDYGQNCLMWSVENGQKGWEYLFRARLFNKMYNSNATDVTQKRILTDEMLRKNTLTPEMREMERSCWDKFRLSEQYGTLVNMDEDLNIDTFIDKIDEQVDRWGITVICVDYLQLIGRGKSGIVAKNELISEAYKLTLQYLKRKKIAGIFPCQFKQNVVGVLGKTSAEEMVNMELRDAAGETYEVIKTPDVNLALYASVADLRNGDMKILSIPSRTSTTFEPIDLYADLGCSTFISVEK
jgi:hypothetical protein